MSTYQDQPWDHLNDQSMAQTQQNVKYNQDQIKVNRECQSFQPGNIVDFQRGAALSGLSGAGSLSYRNPRQDPNDEYFGSQLNDTGITPSGYKILVEIPVPHDLQHAEDNGLVIPETAKDRYTNAAVAAKVIQLGKECYTPDHTTGKFTSGPWVKPGDWIVMSPYSGTRIKSIIMGNTDYRFINDDSVEGIVPGPEYIERGGF